MPRKNRNQADKQRRIDNPEWAESERKRHKEYRTRKQQQTPGRAMVDVAPNHRTRGFSTKVDASGKMIEEWVKTERKPDDPPARPVVPPNFAVTHAATMLDRQGKALIQWVSSKQNDIDRAALFEAAIKEHAETYRGIATSFMPPAADVDEDLLALYGWGDPHVGLLCYARETGGFDFDLKIVEEELVTATDMVVERAPAAGIGLLLNIGDFFSVEDDTQLTPAHKNKQDTDGRFTKITRVGLNIMRRSIDLMRRKHREVRVISVPGNHDPRGSRMLSMLLECLYEGDARVKVIDNTNEFIYQKFGTNLLAFNHGMVKHAALPGIVATDCAAGGVPGCEDYWGTCRNRFIWVGHQHHKTVTDFPGCTVEMLRTLKARDAYENGRGYRAQQSIVQVTYHKEWGERHRQLVHIHEVKNALTQGIAPGKVPS